MSTKVSVVICTYNRCDMLRDALHSLCRMRVPDGCEWEIVVVDNNSRDQTRGVVDAFASGSTVKARYISETRQGKTIALNSGIAAAAGEILLFTDDDAEVNEGWLDAYLKAFNSNDCIGAGGKILPFWECDKPFWAEPDERYRLLAVFAQFDLGLTPGTLNCPPFGPNMAVRRSAFIKYGGFREDLGPRGGKWAGGEETELFRRLSQGGKWLYVPEAVVHHRVTARQASVKFLRNYYQSRGRFEMLIASEPAVRWFGVPRYRLRRLAESIARWFFSLSRRRRLYYWLDMHLQIGALQQAFSMRNYVRSQ